MDEIMAIAKQHHLAVIEDAAHSLPAFYKGKKIGILGDITCFSFYATKTLATGEGGMVTTNDSTLANRIKVMRLHGINRDVFTRYASREPSWYYEVIAPGFKYNMMDLVAAIGIHQLRKLDVFHVRRAEIATRYTDAFADLPVTCPRLLNPSDRHAWHLYVIQLQLEKTGLTRNRFIELMYNAGIGVSVHFIPLHLHPYWRERYRLKPDDFPCANDVYQRVTSLPIYPNMTDADIERVIAAVRNTLAGD
jgi:dTDP-4-amino-4,6-dideoxygalactose transaminase